MTVFTTSYVKLYTYIFVIKKNFWYILDIDVIRNGNNLKLNIKPEYFKYGFNVKNPHSNPYIHSTTVLYDSLIYFNII